MLHLLAMAVGLGGSVANAVIGAMAGPENPALAGRLQKRIGRIAFAALILLWVTGVALVMYGPGAGTLSLWFWVKMLAVLALTGAAVTMQVAILTFGPERRAALARPLGMIMAGSATLAVVFAVLAFG